MRDVTEDEEQALTIDELARQTGMSSRNIRAHQSRGLLPPPDVRGRTGFYGSDHVARLELIQGLQADGFNLEAIRRLLERAGGSTDGVLELVGDARAGFGSTEEPEVLDAAELGRRLGVDRPDLLERAIALGVFRPRDDGRFEVSPRIDRAGRELAALAIPPERALAVVAELRRHAEGVARAYVELFVDEVWGPYDAAGRPAERLPEVRAALARLEPIASDSLLAVFADAMRAAIDDLAVRALGEA